VKWGKCIVLSFLFLQQLVCSAFVPDSTFAKGNIALKKGDYSLAKELFTSFLQQNPKHQTAKYNLALSYFHSGNSEKCLDLITEIPNWERQPENLGLASWCAFNQDLTDSASIWLDKIPDAEKNAEMLLLKAILQNNSNPEDQLTLLNQALILEPGMLEILYYRAKCHLVLKDTASAIQDLNVLLTHQEKAQAYGLRAEIAKSHKDFQLAIKEYNAAFKIDSNAQWKYKLIETYSQSGNYEAAFDNAQYIKIHFPAEIENVQPLFKKLKLYYWIDAYWIYFLAVLILFFTLLYLLIFK
jgi:thioredoxin-like negative regulator of GroEL